MTIPFSREQITAACVETVRVNRLKSCYIRPLVFLGDGEMGLAAVNNPVRVAIIVWSWGAYLGEEGVRNGVRLEDLVVPAHARQHAHDEGQGGGELRELDPGCRRGAPRWDTMRR